MSLEGFSKEYYALEDKAEGIKVIYGLISHSFSHISIYKDKGVDFINLVFEVTYSGCGTESEWLTFELSEMDNDLKYFEDKRQKSIDDAKAKKELAKKEENARRELIREEARREKEKNKNKIDLAEYERLKKLFEK